jgi:uncharacterized membrane protein YtjA (UPF0391 family)
MLLGWNSQRQEAPMMTWAITFLLIAIFAGVFGFVTAGPAGLILFVVFFALFVWSLVQHRRGRRGGPPA